MNNMKQINLTSHTPRALLLLAVLILSACASAGTATHVPKINSSCVKTGNWMDPKTGAYIPASAVVKKAARHDAVLLGEAHESNDHHIWQLQTIAQIHAINPDMILGFEAFPREVQATLDKWVEGDLSEKDFLEQSKWNYFWKFDPDLYMPLFNFARMNRVPMVALNVNRKLVNNVSANGWGGVKKHERGNIDNPVAASAGYIKILEDVFKQHEKIKDKNGKPKKENAFDKFVDVQLIWDRAFAQAINKTLKTNRAAGRTPVMVNIIGRGHVDYGFGVVHQLKSLGVNDVMALTPWDDFQNCNRLNNGAIAVADAVFGISAKIEMDGAAKPKLGVFIEQGKDGVAIKKVAPKSVAESAGIKSGDLLIEAAGGKLKNPLDLINTINSIAPGTWLPLKLVRNNKIIEVVAKFKR